MAMLERAIAIAQDSQDRAGSGQTSMFGEDAAGVVAYPPLPALPEWPPADILRSEKELLGIYISGHPLEKFRDDVQAFSKPPIAELDQVLPGEAVRVCGIVTDVQTRLDKKDKLYARFTLEDFTGSIQAIAFSDVYEKFRALIAVDQLVVLNAKADRREERNTLNLVVSDLLPLSDARPKYAKRVFIRVDAAGPADASLDRMKEVLLKYPGNIPVYFHVSCASGKDMHLRSKKFRVNPVQELIEELRSLVEPEKVCIDG
jgi:DNA polymerase-3 subunit alpha